MIPNCHVLMKTHLMAIGIAFTALLVFQASLFAEGITPA